MNGIAAQNENHVIYSFEDYELDEEAFGLFRQGQRLSIQPRPLNLLLFMARNHGRLVERQELMDHLWPKLSPSQASLDRAIRTARRALGDSGRSPRVIATVRGVGFRFLPGLDVGPSRTRSVQSGAAARDRLELQLEVADLANRLGDVDLARHRSLEAARSAARLGDDEALVRAALLAVGSQAAPDDEHVVRVARDALARVADGSAQRSLLCSFLKAASPGGAQVGRLD